MVNKVDVGCYIFLDHSKCSILTAKYNPDINHFCLYLDYFTVYDDSLNDYCATYAARFHCGLYHNGDKQSDHFLQHIFLPYFSSIAIGSIRDKLIELGFSIDVLNDVLNKGITWDNPLMIITHDSNFYLKMECDKQFLTECDPYYRWVMNG